jgi:hypothetical protein
MVIAVGLSIALSPLVRAADEPLARLKAQAPILAQLYERYPNYRATLENYADRQDFKQPYERLATVVHELIHIDSYVHQGYFIDGVYYEPYLKPDKWPAVHNRDVAPYVLPAEQGVVYQHYMLVTPSNTLANIVDEINAYSHVIEFVCRNEPQSAHKQAQDLYGQLQLGNAYIRYLRERAPAQYQAFWSSREAKGVYLLVMQRAQKALRNCGV